MDRIYPKAGVLNFSYTLNPLGEREYGLDAQLHIRASELTGPGEPPEDKQPELSSIVQGQDQTGVFGAGPVLGRGCPGI